MDNANELIPVLRELHNISGFRISIFDTEFNELAAYPKEQNPFCRLIKANPKTANACRESDRLAGEKVKESKRVYLYQCRFGLYDAVAPLYSFGELTGYMMMGQTIDTLNSSREFVYNNASAYFNDKDELQRAVSKIHIRAKENILSCISIMGICAEYITLSNRLNSTRHDLAEGVKQYIDKNFGRKLSIDGMCGQFFCSRATLMNSFKKKYGSTINTYITARRIEEARGLLLHTSKPIFEIASECGYQDQNYFSKAFFKAVGVPPKRFRIENKRWI